MRDRSSRSRNSGGGSSKALSSFRYTKRSNESIKARADQRGWSFDPLVSVDKVFVPKEGDFTVRILPPTWDLKDDGVSGAGHYGIDVFVHYGVGPENRSYLCPGDTLAAGKPCPVCDERRAEDKRPDRDEEVVRSLRASKRIAVWLIDRDNESDGPKVWIMPWTVDRDIVKASRDKRSGETFYVDDPDEGYDVEFGKHGQGIRTEYSGIQVSRHASPLSDDGKKFDDWLSFTLENPLPSTMNLYPYDYIKRVFHGTKKEDEVEEEEVEKETSIRSRRSGRDTEEEETDEEETDEEEQDDEEEAVDDNRRPRGGREALRNKLGTMRKERK